MLYIKMYSGVLQAWIEVKVYDPTMERTLKTLLEKEENIPKFAKVFLEKGLRG